MDNQFFLDFSSFLSSPSNTSSSSSWREEPEGFGAVYVMIIPPDQRAIAAFAATSYYVVHKQNVVGLFHLKFTSFFSRTA
jgi:hypothetical protein